MFANLRHDRRPTVSRSLRKRASHGRPCPVSVETLEKRELFSADVVLQWNQAVLSAIRTDKPTVGFATRDLAIVHTAIYDAVNAIDRTRKVTSRINHQFWMSPFPFPYFCALHPKMTATIVVK